MDNANSIHLVHRIRMAPFNHSVIIFDEAIATARAEALRDAEEKLERYFDNMFVHGKVDMDDIRAILADKQDK